MKGTSILGGELKRQRIGSLPGKLFVRPILARMKKSLFDILKNRVAHSTFLDLFAGSGAVGLEALSRGAQRVVFIDSNPRCQKWIQRTLEKMSENVPAVHAPERAKVYCSDVLSGLGWLDEKFDVIFSGAPYKDVRKKPLYCVGYVLELVLRDRILESGGWLIAQHHSKEIFKTPQGLRFFRQEKYGDNILSFFEC